MNTRNELKSVASKMECEIDWNNWAIEAPTNRQFVDGGSHTLVFEPYDWNHFTWDDQHRDAINRLKCGLEACHCGDCDQGQAEAKV